MLTLDDATKTKLGQFIDSEGKVVITDDMPEDLKGCLKYINDNNINLFSSNPDAYVDDYEPDPFAPGFKDEEDDSSDVEDEDSDEEDSDEEESEEDSVDDNTVNDLDSVF